MSLKAFVPVWVMPVDYKRLSPQVTQPEMRIRVRRRSRASVQAEATEDVFETPQKVLAFRMAKNHHNREKEYIGYLKFS
jgi:flavoprotein